MTKPTKSTVFGTVVIALVLGISPTGASASSCRATATVPSSNQDAAALSSTLCLINETRASHHLSALRLNAQLQSTASAWSKRIVAKQFFAHIDPFTHGTVATRGKASGYTSGRPIWALGENLAWATGYRGSPKEILSLWLNSPGHRANLLDPQWRDIGIGITNGTPVGSMGSTYAAEFGMRTAYAKPACHRVKRRLHGKIRRVCSRK